MNNSGLIYLDNNATTPCDPQVVEKMLPFFTEIYGNPSNGFHILGRRAARAVEEAREQVATLVNASPNEIVFTSGATESDNLGVLGFARANRAENKKQVITSQIEHKAILNACHKLEEEGFEVFYLPVNPNGVVDPEFLSDAITDHTLLVSIQVANNEIGTVQPIRKLVEIAHHHGAIFHTDAAQAVGKIPVDVEDLGVDLLSISAHKLYGPKGVGGLYIRGGVRSLRLEPLQYGGGQESGLHAGTTNVPGIVGFGEACKILRAVLKDEANRIAGLRDLFEQLLRTKITEVRINGYQSPRLPNTSSLTFPGIDADALLVNLTYTLLGTGSACTSGAIEPSHVLQGIGLSREDASSTIRASLGRFNSEEEISRAADEIIRIIFLLGK